MQLSTVRRAYRLPVRVGQYRDRMPALPQGHNTPSAISRPRNTGAQTGRSRRFRCAHYDRIHHGYFSSAGWFRHRTYPAWEKPPECRNVLHPPQSRMWSNMDGHPKHSQRNLVNETRILPQPFCHSSQNPSAFGHPRSAEYMRARKSKFLSVYHVMSRGEQHALLQGKRDS